MASMHSRTCAHALDRAHVIHTLAGACSHNTRAGACAQMLAFMHAYSHMRENTHALTTRTFAVSEVTAMWRCSCCKRASKRAVWPLRQRVEALLRGAASEGAAESRRLRRCDGEAVVSGDTFMAEGGAEVRERRCDASAAAYGRGAVRVGVTERVHLRVMSQWYKCGCEKREGVRTVL